MAEEVKPVVVDQSAADNNDRNPLSSPTPVLIGSFTETKIGIKDALLASESIQEKEVKEEEKLWYFAIGSMMNPTSMELRNLKPTKSMPGILRGWKLVFRGMGGMGDILESPSDHFHGILHHLTSSEFKHLDTIEGSYLRTPVNIELYNGNHVDAFAYKMDNTKIDPATPNNLPGERYLDIIMRGAVHYGVHQDYIEILKKIHVMPRKKVSEYRSIQTPPDIIISTAELAASTGSDPWTVDHPLLISVNGKVLRWSIPVDTSSLSFSYNWSRNRYGATDITVAVSKVLYEPLYPIPTVYEAMPSDMKAWAEELFVGFTRSTPEGDRLGPWQVIGWLEGMEPEHLKKK